MFVKMISDPSFLILTLQLIYQPRTVKLSGQTRYASSPNLKSIRFKFIPPPITSY